MEVHAHTHTERKKWTHYFWEFLMLFLAVTLGFFVENWREHYIEHKRAKQYAEMLKEDLMKDTVQLSRLIRGTDTLLLAGKNYETLSEMPLDKITVADLKLLSNPGIDLTWFAWNDAAYSQMKNSGNLRLLTNKLLIRKIADYESDIKGLGFYQKAIENFVMSDYSFRASLNQTIFFRKNPGIRKEVLLKQAGYNFNAWDEDNAIWERIINFETNAHELYPEIRKNAAEIIDLLNKEYHLE